MKVPAPGSLGRLLSPFFALTREERRIVCLILTLALLGLAAMAWRRAHAPPAPAAERSAPAP
jgi:hypothetical protein